MFVFIGVYMYVCVSEDKRSFWKGIFLISRTLPVIKIYKIVENDLKKKKDLLALEKEKNSFSKKYSSMSS